MWTATGWKMAEWVTPRSGRLTDWGPSPISAPSGFHTNSNASQATLNHTINQFVWIFSQDFAYIARDPALNKHLCWVFKCERSGDEIATALRSVCLRILKENERFSEKKSNSNRLNNRSGNHLVYESHISKESPKNQSKKNRNNQSKHWNECNG